MTTLRQQLRDNAVALISLAVAISSLSYNTWRNERTEANRNVRTATFELLMRLADLIPGARIDAEDVAALRKPAS